MVHVYMVYELDDSGRERVLASLTAGGYSREPGDESPGYFVDDEGRVVLAVSTRPGIRIREVPSGR